MGGKLNPEGADVDVLPVMCHAWANAAPDKCAIRHVNGTSLTYAELDRYVAGWAQFLRARDVRSGATVACILRPSFDVIGMWLGLGWLRAIMVPINTEYRGTLLRHALESSLASTVVVERDFLDVLRAVLPEVDGVQTVIVVDDPDGPRREDMPIADRAVEILRLSASRLDGDPQLLPFDGRPPRASDIATVPFTSGTTGPSKGVMVPWRQIADMSRSISQFSAYDSDDVFYCPFPWYHASAMFAINLMALVGGTLVVRERFSATRFTSDMREFGCTSTMLLGAMATFLLNQPERPDDHETPLNKVLLAPLVKDLDAFRTRFGVRISTYYNMTEMSGPLVSDGFDLSNPASCGRLSPHYEARIVDEDDEQLPAGAVGELVVRPKRPWSMMSGYWNNDAGSVEAWRNLWFHTGDLFRCDHEENYYLVDRRKDSIRRRGENISSWELECEVNAFEDVQESAAVAVPSVYSEDEIRLFVLPKADDFDPAALYEFLRERLPAFMLPSVIDVVDSMPKTPTERVQKHLLRSRSLSPSTWTVDGFEPFPDLVARRST